MKRYIAVLIFVLIPFLGAGCEKPASVEKDISVSRETEESYPRYKEIVAPAGYVNTAGITIEELIGKKVILLDFVTYSCINCIRTFPYLNAWYEAYKDQGLEIIGIHTPEFAFEKKHENVVQAMQKYGIMFPVVLDNEYGTWRAYGNLYWPRKYLIDIHGNIVYDHIGEGAYEETEKKIQEALAERKKFLGEEGIVQEGGAVSPAADTVDFGSVRSPEVYFGSDRNKMLGNGTPGRSGTFTFSRPKDIRANTLYLVGEWKIHPEYAEPVSSNASIIFRYHAQRVNIVAGGEGESILAVERDNGALGPAAGEHVEDGILPIREYKLYEVVDDPAGSGQHTLEVRVGAPGVKVYTFTFG